MAVEILLPRISPSMQHGQVMRWLAADGGSVTEGEPLFVVHVNTQTRDVEAPATGTLKIITHTGVTYEVGTVLGWIS